MRGRRGDRPRLLPHPVAARCPARSARTAACPRRRAVHAGGHPRSRRSRRDRRAAARLVRPTRCRTARVLHAFSGDDEMARIARVRLRKLRVACRLGRPLVHGRRPGRSRPGPSSSRRTRRTRPRPRWPKRADDGGSPPPRSRSCGRSRSKSSPRTFARLRPHGGSLTAPRGGRSADDGTAVVSPGAARAAQHAGAGGGPTAWARSTSTRRGGDAGEPAGSRCRVHPRHHHRDHTDRRHSSTSSCSRRRMTGATRPMGAEAAKSPFPVPCS